MEKLPRVKGDVDIISNVNFVKFQRQARMDLRLHKTDGAFPPPFAFKK
jgi:hypothetical protein